MSHMNEQPLISVITPVYNGAAYLAELIESVLAQDYAHYEHIIIDDGSNDDGATLAVLRRYPHLRWWTRENRGQYATQNEGLMAAKGDIIVMIAADDVFITPDAFSAVVTCWQSQPDCDIVYGQTRRMSPTGEWLPNIDLTLPPWRGLLKYFVFVQHCSAFVARELAQAHPFDPTYRYRGDWDWLLRIFGAARNIRYLRRPLAVVRVHPGQTSRSSSAEAMRAEDRRIHQTHGGHDRLSWWLRVANNYRAMIILGLHTLWHEGPRAFLGRILKRIRHPSGR